MYAPLPMVPGPVTVPQHVLNALAKDYPSGQIDEAYFSLVRSCELSLGQLLGTKNRILFLSGEGMLALWAALKSVVTPDNTVFVVSTGVFGEGIAAMARSLGAKVDCLSLGFDATISEEDLALIEKKFAAKAPDLLCAVHCETPSGTLNPLAALGELKERYGVPLFYTDVVSSLAGTPVQMDAWHIDLALGGSQKCLSLPPSLCFVGVSPKAWKRIEEVAYQGYDALLPFQNIYQEGRCPYTPNWHGLAALRASLDALALEGYAEVFQRHEEAATLCRNGLADLEIALWPKADACLSPTVTAARIPESYTWQEWKKALGERGLIVAGSFGPMQGKVFRLGHMGSQAQKAFVRSALDIIEEVVGLRRKRMV